MSLRSFLGLEKPFSYIKFINKYSLDTLAEVMSIIVRAKFSIDPRVRTGEYMQFIREEADAMSRAGGYPAQFAQEMFGDMENYAGAMDEDTEYPIDRPGGPQQTLLKMTLDFMREAGGENDLPARFRCAVVGFIAELEMVSLTEFLHPGKIKREKFTELTKRFQTADDILGSLVKSYESYFKQFYGNMR